MKLRKALKRLQVRRRDYETMIGKSNNSKGGWTGYHMPGSNKK